MTNSSQKLVTKEHLQQFSIVQPETVGLGYIIISKLIRLYEQNHPLVMVGHSVLDLMHRTNLLCTYVHRSEFIVYVKLLRG